MSLSTIKMKKTVHYWNIAVHKTNTIFHRNVSYFCSYNCGKILNLVG